MNPVADTYLRQARSFLSAGEPSRAIELLRRAEILAASDLPSMAAVCLEMSRCLETLGQTDRAAAYRRRSLMLRPESIEKHDIGRSVLYPAARWWVIAAPLVLAIAVVAVVGLWPRGASVGRSATTRETAVPVTRAPVGSGSSATEPEGTGARSPTTAPQTVWQTPRPPTGGTKVDKHSIGLLLVVAEYAGTSLGRRVTTRFVIGQGTAFAVTSSGTILTNRHVVDAASNRSLPANLSVLGYPGITFQYTSFVLAQGNGPEQQHEARLLNRSDDYDLAILKVNSRFREPLQFSGGEIGQQDEVYAWGYPAAVGSFLAERSLTPEKRRAIKERFEQDGTFDQTRTLPADYFLPTVTKGIVSAEERHIDNVAYIQFDATVTEGNSGGPLVSAAGKVVGVVTLGSRRGNYNYAIKVEQLRDYLAPYLQSDGSGSP